MDPTIKLNLHLQKQPASYVYGIASFLHAGKPLGKKESIRKSCNICHPIILYIFYGGFIVQVQPSEVLKSQNAQKH